jgi:adenine/guanine phosphoribosyltransferase-like PRPP-binding protein
MKVRSHCILSEYLTDALTPMNTKKLVKAAMTLLKLYDFDAIAFRGISGALVAPILAYRLNKSLLVVRKPKQTDETSHSGRRVEGDLNARRYLIVDDFQSSGNTVQAIVEEISKFAPNARCIGALLYKDFLGYQKALKVVRPRTPLLSCDYFILQSPDEALRKPKPAVSEVLS